MRLVEGKLVELWSSVKRSPPTAVKPARLSYSPGHGRDPCNQASHSPSPPPTVVEAVTQAISEKEFTIPVSQAVKPMKLASARHQGPWRQKQ